MAASSAQTEIEKLKESLSLQPHPEGGYFAETYRAESSVAGAKGERSAGTGEAWPFHCQNPNLRTNQIVPIYYFD